MIAHLSSSSRPLAILVFAFFFAFHSTTYAFIPVFGFVARTAISQLGSYVAGKAMDRTALGKNIDQALDQISGYKTDLAGKPQVARLADLEGKLILVKKELSRNQIQEEKRRKKIARILGGKDEIDGYIKLIEEVRELRQSVVRLQYGYWMDGVYPYFGYTKRFADKDDNFDRYIDDFYINHGGLELRRYNWLAELEYAEFLSEQSTQSFDRKEWSFSASYLIKQDTYYVPSVGLGVSRSKISLSDSSPEETDTQGFIQGRCDVDWSYFPGLYARLRWFPEENEVDFGLGFTINVTLGKSSPLD